MNEISTLFINYGLIIFSDFVGDPETRYKVGFYFIYYVGFVGLINIILVFIDLIIETIPKFRRWMFKDKLKEYHDLKTQMIKFLIIDALK